MFNAVYIDDLLKFLADINPWIHSVMQNFLNIFQSIDLGNVSPYLVMKVNFDFNKRQALYDSLLILKKLLDNII